MHLYKLNRSFTGPGEAYGSGAIGPIAGALLGPIGGLYDTYQSNKTAKRNTDRTIAANKAEAELAYQRQVEMWHLQNQYNSPEQQMQRFGAAGLNPHLIYGQGNSGNSQGTPNYQPPNMQYKYAAPAYGAAIGGALPTLMAVGTWMQNMKMSEVDMRSKETNIEKAEQLVEFLRTKYPHEIRKFDQAESMWPYQQEGAEAGVYKQRVQVADLLEKFRQDWGSKLGVGLDYKYSEHTDRGKKATELTRLKQDILYKAAQTKLSGMQAEWFEPQTIMKLVMGGLLAALPIGKAIGIGGRVASKTAGSARKLIDKVRTTTRKNRVGTDTYKKYYYHDK